MKATLVFMLTSATVLSLFFSSCIQEPQKSSTQNFKFLEFDINQMQSGYEKEQFTSVDVVKAYISRIESIDASGPSLNSIIMVNPDAVVNCFQNVSL